MEGKKISYFSTRKCALVALAMLFFWITEWLAFPVYFSTYIKDFTDWWSIYYSQFQLILVVVKMENTPLLSFMASGILCVQDTVALWQSFPLTNVRDYPDKWVGKF